MEENGSAGMLVAKRLAGVAPEVNLRECVADICASTKHKYGQPTLKLKLRRDATRSSKQGYQLPHKRTLLCPPK